MSERSLVLVSHSCNVQLAARSERKGQLCSLAQNASTTRTKVCFDSVLIPRSMCAGACAHGRGQDKGNGVTAKEASLCMAV